ncbi:hypothetical protein [Actinokineospora diospyrosa]|uniref:Uncharacterized protein n=1 Tax=Actinokineospora diospyrosa TaxID=103728 RepID=A0ABT1IEX9_9PSEU|nr:hypothetical protein [Actinokineospora diospyrosa]MCP2271114.1 hypothetical protein [Actinokineospora diospyrosa]
MTPEIEAAVVAAAVNALPQVAGPHSGRYGEIATYLPGRRIDGVRVRATEIAVGVVARYPATVAEVGPGGPAPHVWIGDVVFPHPAAALEPPRRPVPSAPRPHAPATTARTAP